MGGSNIITFLLNQCVYCSLIGQSAHASPTGNKTLPVSLWFPSQELFSKRLLGIKIRKKNGVLNFFFKKINYLHILGREENSTFTVNFS